MTLDLNPNAGSVGLARDAARNYFAGCGTTMSMDVELVVSELVTNAIRHGQGGIALHLTLDDGQAMIAVHDGSHELPVMRQPNRATPGGRGLHIVNEIAAEWGAFPTHDGKAVWCRVPTETPTDLEGG